MTHKNDSPASDLDARFERAFEPLSNAVAEGRIPGGVLGIVEKGGARKICAIGLAQKEPTRHFDSGITSLRQSVGDIVNSL